LQSKKVPLYRIDGLYPIIEPANGLNPTSIPNSWAEIAKQVLSSEESPIVCTVGAKGYGKSTLSRYLVNRLLTKYVLKGLYTLLLLIFHDLENVKLPSWTAILANRS
jgi:polynucleotide 5'-kinase involved in rRNA processing